MPDLIIKPTATSGNKLILKDQANNAVLTTSDSGVSHLSTPAGHILQVVNSHNRGTGSGNYVAHSGAWTSTELSATITLKQANAKVFISYSQSVEFYGTNESGISIKCFGNLASAGDVAIEETEVGINVRCSYSSINYVDQAVCSGHVETLSNSAGQAWVVTVKGYEHSDSTYTHLDTLGNTRASNLTLMEIAV